MEFSKNSWHYKLVNKFYGEEYFINYESRITDRGYRGAVKVEKNISLCKYFWSVVLATFATALYMPIKYIIVLPLSFIIRKILSIFPSVEVEVNLPKMSYETKDKIGKIMLIFFLGVIGGLAIYGLMVNFWTTFWYIIEIGIITGMYIGGRLATEALAKRRMNKEKKFKPPKDPNLVKEFVKAKKSKICPIIKFRDDQDINDLNEDEVR